MRQFNWIEWNLEKIDSHALSAEEVEAAFDRVFSLQETEGRLLSDVRGDTVGPSGLGDLAV